MNSSVEDLSVDEPRSLVTLNSAVETQKKRRLSNQKRDPSYLSVSSRPDLEDGRRNTLTPFLNQISQLPGGRLDRKLIKIRRVVEDYESQSCCRRHRKRIITWTIFVVVIILIVIYSQQVQRLVKDFKIGIKEIDTGVICAIYIVVAILRSSVPFLYFLFPFDTIAQIVLAEKLEIYTAVLAWQLMSYFIQLISYMILKLAYRPMVSQFLFEDDEEESGVGSCFKDMRRFLVVADLHMYPLLHSGTDTWYKQPLVILAIYNAEMMSVFIATCLFATRWTVLSKFFCWDVPVSGSVIFFFWLAIAFVFEFPSEIVQFRILKGALDALSEGDFYLVISKFEWWELVLYVLICVPCTIYIHYHTLSAVLNGFWMCCCKKKHELDSDNEDFIGSLKRLEYRFVFGYDPPIEDSKKAMLSMGRYSMHTIFSGLTDGFDEGNRFDGVSNAPLNCSFHKSR